MKDKMTNKSLITEIIEFNPKRTIKRGSIAPFVEMAALPENARDVERFEDREFKGGGSRFQNTDTLFARITPCLENGKTAKVNILPPNTVAHGSTEFIVMAAKQPEIDEDFVYYLARLPEFREYAKSRMEGTSGRQRVSWQSLAEYELHLPKPEKRKKIGAVLRKLDDKIQLNQQINQTLEAMAQALFKSWFVDFEPTKAKIAALEAGGSEEDANLAAMQVISGKTAVELEQLKSQNPENYQQLYTTAQHFPTAMQDSELGEIPEGWHCLSLDEVANYLNGLALQKFRPKNDDADFLPVLKIAQLRKGATDSDEKASVNIKPEYIVNDGDVIFSWSGSLLVDIWCGGKAALNQHLFKVTSDKYPKWLYYYYTKHHLDEFQRIASYKAVTMGHIKRSHLEEAKCVIPSPEILEIISKTFEGFLSKAIDVRLENNSLNKIRDELLPKLLSGELSVESLEIPSHD